MNDILINENILNKIKSRVPVEDFIDSKYDYLDRFELTDVLVIFSTPRSGSTFLCDLIYKNSICTPHEYFQYYDYIPLLAERWECIERGRLNKSKFLKALIDNRTAPSGWMGINLHGEHLSTFSKFEALFPEVNFHYIHVIREDSLSQAVSYEIALQTGKWSSNFASQSDAKYNFLGIKQKLERIHHQNDLIKSYIKLKNIPCKTVYYEKLILEPQVILKDLLPISLYRNLVIESNLKRQSSTINEEWILNFSKENFETDNSENKQTQTIKKRLKKLFKLLSRK